ncbi:MAG TPA: hypothetical protein VEP90_25585 [Methylomirabilota bacterium]|nr:hypothetical protein [Methylomirabilota bacterium]
MKLVRAVGNFRLQRALSNTYVNTIVDVLLQHQDTLMIVADLLQTCVQKASPELKGKIEGIHKLYRIADETGNLIIPNHISRLIEALEKLYQQNNEIIEDQRGAIVELLGRKLVCPRYDARDFCFNSGRFVDEQSRDITLQEVDVAALSDTRYQVEAYECKMRSNKLMNDDCTDLEYLVKASEERGYRANVGVISFDNDEIVRRKLKRLYSPDCVKVYGLESMKKLRESPFE